MYKQLSERGKDLVKYMPQAVNALADRMMEKLEERLLYGEKPQTNADRIRAMSDEELADMLDDKAYPFKVWEGLSVGAFETSYDAWLWWLRQEVE